jgi:hypothetical protein
VETISSYLTARHVTRAEFEQAHPYDFLRVELTPKQVDTAKFGLHTEAASEMDLVEQLRELEDLGKEGRRLSAAAFESIIFKVLKRTKSPFQRQISIGRTDMSDITIPDSRVSQLHAYVETDPGGKQRFLTDAGSSNGTKINSVAIKPHLKVPFEPGDVLEFGPLKSQLLSAGMLWDFLQTCIIAA